HGYHARPMQSAPPMTREALTRAPERAADHEEWVRILAEHFDAAGLFYGHGTDNAGDKAFWLIRHFQGWRVGAFEASPDVSLAGPVAEVAERRATLRKPLAYLLGEAWFAGLPFFVDENVLVPRSPLAEVIEAAFAPWVELGPGDRILDVGTGSGCLAIAAAVHCEGAIVDATDVSAAALAVARRNVERHGVADRVRLVEADLFPATDERYRVIMSNPPYVPARELQSLPPEYRR